MTSSTTSMDVEVEVEAAVSHQDDKDGIAGQQVMSAAEGQGAAAEAVQVQ